MKIERTLRMDEAGVIEVTHRFTASTAEEAENPYLVLEKVAAHLSKAEEVGLERVEEKRRRRVFVAGRVSKVRRYIPEEGERKIEVYSADGIRGYDLHSGFDRVVYLGGWDHTAENVLLNNVRIASRVGEVKVERL